MQASIWACKQCYVQIDLDSHGMIDVFDQVDASHLYMDILKNEAFLFEKLIF